MTICDVRDYCDSGYVILMRQWVRVGKLNHSVGHRSLVAVLKNLPELREGWFEKVLGRRREGEVKECGALGEQLPPPGKTGQQIRRPAAALSCKLGFCMKILMLID